MTPTELEYAARRRINAEASNFWSSEEIIQNYLYELCLEMSIETMCIENIYTTTSVASQAEYSRPDRALKIVRVTYDSEKLMPVDMRQYDYMNTPTSVISTGEVQYYMEFDDTITLFKTPATSGKTIKIWTIDQHDSITTTSTIEIPVRYQYTLVDGLVWKMTSKEIEDPRTNLYYQVWQNHLKKIAQLEKKRKTGDRFKQVKTEGMTSVNDWGII